MAPTDVGGILHFLHTSIFTAGTAWLVLDFGGTVLGVYTVIGRYPLTADSDHPLDFFHNFPLKLADVTITQFLNKFLHLSIS